MTPEGKVKEQVKKILKELGAWYFMPVQIGLGVMGIPDFLICYKGRFYAIECKSGKAKATALQARALDSIRNAGGSVAVVNEDALPGLKSWLTLHEHQGV